MFAHGVGQSTIAIVELRSEFLRTLEDEQRMAEGMVPDDMPGLHQFTNNVGPLLHVASDQKKRGVNFVPGQHVQQALGVRIVGTVIIGEGQLLRSVAQPGEGTAKPLPSRRHGLVARSRSSSGNRADQVAQHDVAIVNGAPIEGIPE